MAQDENIRDIFRYSQVFDNSRSCLIILSASGRTVEKVNQQFVMTLGYDINADTDLEQLYRALFPDEVYREIIAESLQRSIRSVIEGRIDSKPLVVKLKTREGGFRHFESYFDPLGDGVLVTLVDVTSRMGAERALQEEKNFSETLIASLPGIFFAFDDEYRLIRRNENFTRFFGDAIPKGIIGAAYQMEDRQLIEDAERNAYREGSAVAEARIGKEGIWHLLSLASMTVEGRSLLIGTGNDISLRKKTERELFLIQAVLKSVSEAPDFASALRIALGRICGATGCAYGESWFPSADGSVLIMGPVWYEADEKLQKFAEQSRSFSFLSGEGLPGAVWKSGTPKWIEDTTKADEKEFLRGMALRRSGLRTIWAIPITIEERVIAVLAFGMRQHFDAGHELIVLATAVAHAVGSVMLRKQTEGELRKLSLAVLRSPVSVIVTDRAGNIEFVNPRFTEVAGYDREEVIGKNPSVLNSGRQTKAFYKTLWKTILTGRTWKGEFINRKKDGTEYIEQASIAPIQDENDRITHFVAVKEDITEKKRAEAEIVKAREIAESANRAKSSFLAMMSHEIRTPMNAIIGMAFLGLKTELTPKQRNYLERIWESANNLLGIINDILDFSKIEAGKMELETVDFSLNDVLKSVASTVADKAREKGLDLVYRVEREVPDSFVGDPLRLGQVLVNLIGNALKFTADGSVILRIRLLSVSSEGMTLEFDVRDTGIGMSAQEITGLFKPFVQADSSTTRKFGGTGLGLAICAKIVDWMGGSIRAEGESGKGSTFVFTASFGRRKTKQLAGSARKFGFSGKRACVSLPDGASKEALVAYLVSSGIIVDSESPPAASLDCDFVFSGWNTVDASGKETIRSVANYRSKRAKPKIIALVPYGMGENIHETYGDILDGTVETPFTGAALQAVLNEATRIPRRGKSEREGPPADEKKNTLAKRRILVVDDNELNRQVAIELLEGEGYEATAVESGNEALAEAKSALLKGSPFDLILMDLQMPGMNGFQTTREFRKIADFANTPILAMSADAQNGVKEEAIDAGMNDYLGKPIDPAELFRNLDSRLGSSPKSRVKLDPHPRLPGALPGLDIDAGIANIGGNGEFYLRLLGKFRDDYEKIASTIQTALDAADRETAHRIAHSLKGIAGTIGAKELSRSAAALEQTIAEGADISLQLESFTSNLECVIESAGAAIQSAETDTVKAPRIGLPTEEESRRAAGLLSELDALLARDIPSAESLFKEIEALLRGGSAEAELVRIESFIAEFEIESARIAARSLIDLLAREKGVSL
ncbi:MAG: PAS domain S-box protein [Treponemataceae bacterium]